MKPSTIRSKPKPKTTTRQIKFHTKAIKSNKLPKHQLTHSTSSLSTSAPFSLPITHNISTSPQSPLTSHPTFQTTRNIAISSKSPNLTRPTRQTPHNTFSTKMSLEIERLHVSKRFCEVSMAGPFVFLAGQLADDIDCGIKEQTTQTLNNIDKFLADAKTDKSRIMSVTIYLKDMTDYSAMNEVWDAWVVPGKPPARTCVESKLYDPKVLVEMTVTALRGPDSV